MRFISKKDCGSFLYDTCRIPFVTGCKFLLPTSDLHYTDFTMTSKIVSVFNQMGLLLQIWHKKNPASPFFQLFFGCLEHLEFIELLAEPSTLYLLEGPPIEVFTHNRSEFINRLSRAGQGIVISNAVRESLHELADFSRENKSSIVG
ncbi:MAG: hypothetical protein JWN30_679 [Bacilli bacterium]|nr:hypothetical protein [Bacilli bacterium]